MEVSRYFALRDSLDKTGTGSMMCHGNSMLPVLPNPSICFFRKLDRYQVGDIVFCKVNGRFIDAHRITKAGPDGRFMIANNHGHENGWASQIYGKVVVATDKWHEIVYRSPILA